MTNAFSKLGRHALIYTLGTLAGKAASFVLLPLYTRYLNPADFGVLEMLSITTEITSIVLGAGLSGALIRYWKKYDSVAEQRTVASTALGAVLLLGAVGILLAVLLHPTIARLVLGGSRFAFALELMFIATFFEIAIALPMDLMRAQERSVLYTTVSLLRGIANMALTIYLVAGRQMGVLGAVWANVIISGLAAPLILLYTLTVVRSVKISLVQLRELLRYGLPIVPAALALYALHSTGRFFLRSHIGLAEVGLFSLGFKISVMVQVLVTSPFNQVWSWLMFDVAKREQAAETTARIMTYYLLVASGFALFLCALSRDLLHLMAAPAYWSAYAVVPTIIIGYIAYGAEGITSAGLYIKERTLYRAYLVFGAAGLNVVLNELLVPVWRMQGAAAAGSLSFILLLLGSAFLARRLFPVPWEIKRYVHLLAVNVALGALAFATIQYYPGILPGAILRGLIALSMPVWLLLTGFFRPEELGALRRLRSKVVATAENING